ncbi:hypothetical protein [Paractinoplanes maris]|uniref:hypothetical protein n=1 Tax=Paractinoplanes maris TaxID=1734446 RepID=UPI00202101FD|nr:hypothetical protein [Actinoplanes maris]
MEDDSGPVLAAIRAAFGTSTRLSGLAPDLVVTDPDGWHRAADLTGAGIGLLAAAGQRHWPGPPHVAAALSWKAYSSWLAVPVAFTWVAAHRVARVAASDVLVRFDARPAPICLGLSRAGLESGPPADEATLRRVLLDEHVDPLLDAVQRTVRLSRRLLLGSLAAGIAHATRHAVRVVPGASPDAVGTLLAALGVDQLVEWAADPVGQITVRRRTCCLAFTLPEPRFCTDCCYSAPQRARV